MQKKEPDSPQWSPGTGQEAMAHTEIQKIPSADKKIHLYCVGGSTQAQGAQRGYGVPILGDTQTPTGHSPEQPAVDIPARARVGWDSLRWWLPASATLTW